MLVTDIELEGKYSLESTHPRESKIRAHLRPKFCVEWVELRMYYLFIMRQMICWFVYIGKIPRFGAFLDSKIHTRLITENELGLAFPLGTFPKNFVQIRPRFI